MLPYKEANPNNTEIGDISLRNLRKSPDTVIITETLLKIPTSRKLTKEFCHAAKGRKGNITI
jgi:hypothetical protein